MSDCIFCKIINGDFNTEFVYENEYAVVFKDINPKADIHLLVVPRIHVESLNELDDENLLGKLMMTVKEATNHYHRKVGDKLTADALSVYTDLRAKKMRQDRGRSLS